METPTSMRMVTRSQSAALLKKNKMQEEAKRLPLLDISNDSPIIGLKTEKTPINNSSKKESNTDKRDPQPGQKLLRNQAKTLLQTFEEEKDEIIDTKNIISHEVVSTPSEEENQSNLALVFDSSAEESEISCESINSSFLMCETQSQNSSVWSMQVNASSEKDEIEVEFEEDYEEEYFEEDYEEEYDYENEGEEEGDFCDELCKGMNKMCIIDETDKFKNLNLPEFRGTRTKFVYNSEDGIEDEVTILRGLPAPEGTHLRFCDEEN
ncbi:hypothetical protein LUZ60_002528 [Juncus effusus]|nr:hypothetical protein LUZ60_002528 [Juncus effusus]